MDLVPACTVWAVLAYPGPLAFVIECSLLLSLLESAGYEEQDKGLANLPLSSQLVSGTVSGNVNPGPWHQNASSWCKDTFSLPGADTKVSIAHTPSGAFETPGITCLYFKSVIQIGYDELLKRNLKNIYIAYFRLAFKILHHKLTKRCNFLSIINIDDFNEIFTLSLKCLHWI